MSQVLFVKSSDRTAEEGVSVKLYEAFLAAYKENNPNDEVIELDLHKENLPYLGRDMINHISSEVRKVFFMKIKFDHFIIRIVFFISSQKRFV